MKQIVQVLSYALCVQVRRDSDIRSPAFAFGPGQKGDPPLSSSPLNVDTSAKYIEAQPLHVHIRLTPARPKRYSADSASKTAAVIGKIECSRQVRSVNDPRSIAPSFFVPQEHILYLEAERVRDAESEWQRRIELTVLDRVDGVARDVHALGQLGLAPTLLGAQHANAVFHVAAPSQKSRTLGVIASRATSKP